MSDKLVNIKNLNDLAKKLDKRNNDNIAIISEKINEIIENLDNTFSGDYNDLENRPCYDTRVFETITSPVIFNGDLTDKTIVEIVPEVNTAAAVGNAMYYSVKISDTVPPVINGELSNFEVTMFDTFDGEKTLQDQDPYINKNDSYISFNDCIFFVYSESIITTYHGELTLTPGIWLCGMQDDDGYESYIKNYNMTFLLEGELKKLPSQFVDYMPGKKLEGETFVVSIAQTGSDGYLEQVDNVEQIAEEGSEIFNDYNNNKAIGKFSHSEGTETMAVDTGAHAEGAGTKALGYASHAEGNQTRALGNGSHSEGIRSIAIGGASHSEGYETEANGERGHVEGANTKTARGTYYGHAEGYYTEANGQFASHAEGYYTKASSSFQHVQGKFNIEDTEEKYAHIVGNGTNNANRKNVHTLDWSGNAWFQGNVSVDGTPTNDKDLVTKKYVDNTYLPLTGGLVTGNVQIDGNLVNNNNATFNKQVTFNDIATLGAGANLAGNEVQINADALVNNSPSTHNQAATFNEDAIFNKNVTFGEDAVLSGNKVQIDANTLVNNAVSTHNQAATFNGETTFNSPTTLGAGANLAGNEVQINANTLVNNAVSTHNQAATFNNTVVFNEQATFSKDLNVAGNVNVTAETGDAWFNGNVSVGADNKQLATEEFVNTMLDGLRLMQITREAYDALETKDPSTLYIII